MFGISKLSMWSKMKKRYDKGEIDSQMFVDAMKSIKIYYSTPMGNDQNGAPQLYILSSHKSNDKYFPVFLSKEHCTQFFTSIGRNGFIILEGDLEEFLSLLDTNDMLSSLGTVIEPNFPDEITIPPGVRVTK